MATENGVPRSIAETIDLRVFLQSLRLFDQLVPIAQMAMYRGIYIRGYSRMKKGQLVDAICAQLTQHVVLTEVVSQLSYQIDSREYTPWDNK